MRGGGLAKSVRLVDKGLEGSRIVYYTFSRRLFAKVTTNDKKEGKYLWKVKKK